jgi:hypothetical protein
MKTLDDDKEMDSLYASGEPDEAAKPKGDTETVDQEEQETNTAVAPVKVLQGKGGEPLKEGDEVVVKILKVYGDQAEFAYSSTKPGEIGGGGEGDYGAEIDSMDKAGGNPSGNPGGMGY